MAKDAIFIQIFPSSILAFIFLCSITILADPKPPDPDIPIRIENGRNGNLGEWEYFVQQAYQISSQCYRVPEQNEVFSNRLHVRCKHESQADGASLLVCYPSVLDSDPDAFPDEDDEGLTPALQPTMMESITVDPKSNITIECNELMEKCKSTPKCPMPKMAKKWGEKWHGFRVTRRQNGFQIELPFGNGDGNDIKIDVPDLANEHPQFFINFAKQHNLLSEIIRGSCSNPEEDKAKYKVFDEKDQQKLETYKKARKWGIDLNNVKGLWMLAFDILPVEEKQLFKGQEKEIDEPMIRWFTKSKPAVETTKKCVEIDDKLQLNNHTKEYYISVQYLTPSTVDPQNDGFFTNGQKQGQNEQTVPEKIIELKENESRIVKIGQQILDGTTIRIRAQSTKGKFTIKLLIGFERENDLLGERIFAIYVDFKENKPVDQCYVMDNNKNKIACNNEVNPFLRANETGSAFWLQMEFKDGTEIHFNFDCTELMVPVKKIPYSQDAYIMFEGDMKLIKDENEKLLKIKEGNEMDDNFPTLMIAKLEENLNVNNVLYLSGSTRINSQIKISFVQLDGQEETGQMTLISNVEVNVTKKGSILAKWVNETNLLTVESDQNQGKNDKLVFVLLSRDDANKFLLTINGKQMSSEKDFSNFTYVQVSGDIRPIDSPVFMANLAENYKMPKKFDTNVIPNELNVPLDSYIIFYLLFHYKSSTENKITINLSCSISTCSKSDSALLLTIDLKNKILDVETNEFNRGKSPRYANWYSVDEKLNQPLTTKWTIAQPVWLIIKQNQRLNDTGHGDGVYKYNVLINGENQIAIKSYNKDHFSNDFDEISMQGDFFLFNKIIPFPLRFTMKNKKSENLPTKLKISVKGVVMPNAELLEFILATPEYDEKKNEEVEKYNDIERLGINGVEKFNGDIFLHVRANQTKNEICIGKEYNRNGPCNALRETSPFIGGKPFSIEFIGENWKNTSLIVQVNKKPFELKRNDFEAMYLVIMGDMVLFDSPKCEPECPNKK